MLVTPRERVYERLAARQHRRFIKTHPPLDGIPIDERATNIVVARDPLDLAVSLYHHGDNLDRERIRLLTKAPEPAAARPPAREWLLRWINRDVSHLDELDSRPGVLWHLSGACARREQPNIVLVHYDDLSRDLGGKMRRLARRLDIEVPARCDRR
ncbi:MAG: sulfotransferase domain-containing protein [Mycobacteriales bacterium]